MNSTLSTPASLWRFIRKDIGIIRRYLWVAALVYLSYGAMFFVATGSFIVACMILLNYRFVVREKMKIYGWNSHIEL